MEFDDEAASFMGLTVLVLAVLSLFYCMSMWLGIFITIIAALIFTAGINGSRLNTFINERFIK